MEEWINRLSEQPAFAAVMIVLLGATLFFIIRRVFSLALVLAVGLAAVVGYFVYTGEEPPDALKELTEKAREGAEKASEKAREAKEKIGEELKEAAKAGVKEALED